MPFTAVPGTIQAVVNGTQNDGDPWANVFHFFLGAAAFVQGTSDAYGTFLQSELYSPILAVMRPDTVITDVTCTDLRVAGAAQFVSTAGAGLPVVGTDNAHPALPPQASAMLKWTTAFRGAAGRGRTYLPTMTTFADDGGVLASVRALTDEFIVDVIARGDMVIVSRFLGTTPATSGKSRLKPVPRIGGPITNVITGGVSEIRWRSQRRRQVQ
jgi:hypothetical protein